jgi:hypothetical protein
MLVHCLRDGIYPTWPTFVNTMPKPQGKKRVHFEHLACCELGLQLCVDLLKGICPRGNNKVVIIIFHVYDKCLFLMLELY